MRTTVEGKGPCGVADIRKLVYCDFSFIILVYFADVLYGKKFEGKEGQKWRGGGEEGVIICCYMTNYYTVRLVIPVNASCIVLFNMFVSQS